jgi:hypothetical protein
MPAAEGRPIRYLQFNCEYEPPGHERMDVSRIPTVVVYGTGSVRRHKSGDVTYRELDG